MTPFVDLRLIYNDKTCSYEELLSKDSSVSMNHKNLQKPVMETCYGNLLWKFIKSPIDYVSNTAQKNEVFH